METIFVARQSVTDFLDVAMVFESTAAAIDSTAAIKVFILDVTGAVVEVTGLKSVLVGYTFFEEEAAAGIFEQIAVSIGLEVVFSEVTVGLEAQIAPYSAPE